MQLLSLGGACSESHDACYPPEASSPRVWNRVALLGLHSLRLMQGACNERVRRIARRLHLFLDVPLRSSSGHFAAIAGVRDSVALVLGRVRIPTSCGRPTRTEGARFEELQRALWPCVVQIMIEDLFLFLRDPCRSVARSTSGPYTQRAQDNVVPSPWRRRGLLGSFGYKLF